MFPVRIFVEWESRVTLLNTFLTGYDLKEETTCSGRVNKYIYIYLFSTPVLRPPLGPAKSPSKDFSGIFFWE
jgi:hypothetical protein